MTRTTCVIPLLVAAAATAVAAPPASAQPAPAAAATTPHFHVERHGAGPAMILIPGLLSGGEVWDGTVARFAAEFDMHVLTLAGFAGVRPTDARPFLAGVRDAIIAYIREQQLERPVLVGHSLGAFLSLWIAATAPDLVGPVIAVDGVPFLSALGDTTITAERAAPHADAIRAAFAGMSAETLREQTRMAMTAQVKDTAWHTIGARWGAASDAPTAGHAVAEMLTTDLREDVARITTPVLLFMAADGLDADQRATVLDRYRGQLAGVRTAHIVAAANARHFIMIDDPAFLHDTMSAFLAGR